MGTVTAFVAGQMFACIIMAALDAVVWKRNLWVYILAYALGAGIFGIIFNALV